MPPGVLTNSWQRRPWKCRRGGFFDSACSCLATATCETALPTKTTGTKACIWRNGQRAPVPPLAPPFPPSPAKQNKGREQQEKLETHPWGVWNQTKTTHTSDNQPVLLKTYDLES